MTKQDVVSLYIHFSKMKEKADLSGASLDLKFYIIKTLKALDAEVSILKELEKEFMPKVYEYQMEVEELKKKEAPQEEFEKLFQKYKADIDFYNKKNAEYAEHLKKDADVKLTTIDKSALPDWTPIALIEKLMELDLLT